MSPTIQVSGSRWGCVLGALLVFCSVGFAADFNLLCADRVVLERVYHNHRLGQKLPFEQALPHATLENLVREDLRKEMALRKIYGIEVTTAQLDAEVRRINSTTRAPEMLAEIKIALGNDPARFARTLARPILVERLLREKFDNDDALHSSQRQQAEQMRNELLAAKTNGANSEKLLVLLKRRHSSAVTEITWQLGPRPVENNAPSADEIEIKKRFGPAAQILSSPPAAGKDRTFYFEELPGELQQVLRVQVRQSGDVSAVIEMPSGFAVYLATSKSEHALAVATRSLRKRSFEQWLQSIPTEDVQITPPPARPGSP